MAETISLYLRSETLRKLDAAVKRCAQSDRAAGKTGRQVTNRSRFIEKLLGDCLEKDDALPIEDIQYYVVSLAEEYGAARVSLFGSYARGEADASSDVDILLEKGAVKGMRVLDFQDELARLLGRKVDLVTTAGISERFLSKIKQDEVVLYEAS